MRTLYHYPLCPFSRKIRFLLAEKKLDVLFEIEPFWEHRDPFLRLNPLSQVPVFIDLNGTVLVESYAITEYLEEAYPEKPFLGTSLQERAEERRLISFFDDLFAKEITLKLTFEKHFKRFLRPTGASGPDSHKIRETKQNLLGYLHYLISLIDQRNWIAGDRFSLADITAAAHLSIIDYLGDIPWEAVPPLRDWYARLKSRPTFRPFLSDRAPGLSPPSYYADLDF